MPLYSFQCKKCKKVVELNLPMKECNEPRELDCGELAERVFVPTRMFRGHSIFPEGGMYVEHISEQGQFFETRADLKKQLARQNKAMPGIFD